MGELGICEMERDELSGRYWDLVRKLAKCEKERDEERRAREEAEYDNEYYARELNEGISHARGRA